MKKVPSQEFQPDQVVFITLPQGNLYPSKIILKSSYGTYKIKIYGNKHETFMSQYNIEKYSEETAEMIGEQAKKNKKLIKFLKSAQKDHNRFLERSSDSQPVRFCKQEEQEMEQKVINQTCFTNESGSKYQAIINLNSDILIESLKHSDETTYSIGKGATEKIFRERTIDLLIKKLKWSLEDISLERSSSSSEKEISTILGANIIEPVEFVTTSLYNSLLDAIEALKKNKRAILKNQFINKQKQIIDGFENYMSNFSLFLRARDFTNFQEGDLQTNLSQDQASISQDCDMD